MRRRVTQRHLLALLGAWGLLAVGDPASGDPLGVANTVRKACGAGSAAPLNHAAPLDTAAQRIADGASLRAAVDASGYRARNATLLSLDGVRTEEELARAIAQSCGQITQAGLRDIGAFQSGKRIWLVLAEPFTAPQLDAAKTGAQILDLVNRARAQPRRCGNQDFAAAPALRWSATLERAALAHAHDMAARGALSHAGSDGSTPPQRVTRVGYVWSATGENVAAGQRDSESVVKSWLASPGHCANLMSPDYTEMAVAFATSAATEAGIYWAQVFGAPMNRTDARAVELRRR
jgi:uncharacterized protein YkwD